MDFTVENKQSLFQLVTLGVFAALAVVGVIVLALPSDGGSRGEQAIPTTPITIWGASMPAVYDMDYAFAEMGKRYPVLQKITYREKHPETIYPDLLEAIAAGSGIPDIILFNQSELLTLQSKLYKIPYKTYPLATYQDTYVESASVYLDSEGVYALPIAVDPLVLFWNRDLFRSAAIPQVPDDWTSFVDTVPLLTETQNGADVVRAGVALGEYDNVLHAKEILSALLLQLRVPIVTSRNTTYQARITGSGSGADSTAALRFYTDFSNPRKLVYTWNKTFERSLEAFASNKLAMYFGFVSEIDLINNLNPNLNFNVSTFPQSSSPESTKTTYANVYAVGITANSPHKTRAYQVAQFLASGTMAGPLQALLELPSARRDSLPVAPDDPYQRVLVQSAIMAQTWPEPRGGQADQIFRAMVNNVTTRESRLEGAISTAQSQLSAALSSE